MVCTGGELRKRFVFLRSGRSARSMGWWVGGGGSPLPPPPQFLFSLDGLGDRARLQELLGLPMLQDLVNPLRLNTTSPMAAVLPAVAAAAAGGTVNLTLYSNTTGTELATNAHKKLAGPSGRPGPNRQTPEENCTNAHKKELGASPGPEMTLSL